MNVFIINVKYKYINKDKHFYLLGKSIQQSTFKMDHGHISHTPLNDVRF